ncbi:hypothetical protein EIP91_011163 [Steccherinum ochraceum]|uniref:Glucose-methanol-choline oxidoreductase N-terminal domain-containing protein n=1 Tax=Steccherinum ochraceum TaxID=92696 RepID=A0A4R0RYQ4_9APHY|nr:hypothetical protein EIP91_011163 [Steccherinum ochraceum]
MLVTIEQVAGKTFHYVIVGGGAAGIALAAKLSEDASKTVLVLEAGHDNLNDPAVLRPSHGDTFGNDKYAWNLQTVPQPHTNNRAHIWTRGKGIGGSTAINILAYSKPPAYDVDAFERLGNPGFNWKNLQTIFNKFEGYVPPTDTTLAKSPLIGGLEGLGTEGSLKLTIAPGMSHLQAIAREAVINNGIPHAASPYAGETRGFSVVATSWDTSSMTRSYGGSAFYKPNSNRPNLLVLARAHVHRVVTKKLENGDVTATGVEFNHEGKNSVVHVGKDVVVCAGTLLSPKVLELSGIGDKKVLDKFGIPVKVDLPGVGANAQEHIGSGISFELKDGVAQADLKLFRDGTETTPKPAQDTPQEMPMFSFTMASLDQFSSRSAEIIKTAKETIKSRWDSYSPGLQKQYELQLERLEQKQVVVEMVFHPGVSPASNAPSTAFPHVPVIDYSLTMFVDAPSAGKQYASLTQHITSADPAVPPEVDPHYFEEDLDLQLMVEDLRFLRKLAATSPLKDIMADELNPGVETQSDEELRNFIKSYLVTTWRGMLPREQSGVVDSKFKVYGTTNIRVADLSVLPLQVASHTQSVAYAIGTYAAGVIVA